MKPLFCGSGTTPPPHSLAVDGGLAGCEASYSHWPGHPPPPDIAADTSTAILLRAALDAKRWLSPYAWCCNDHIDCDGLLAMTLACRPELAIMHGPTMVGAAAYGDFCFWTGERAARLALRIHALIRDEQQSGGEWEQRCCDICVTEFERLISESEQEDEERDAQVRQIILIRDEFMQSEPESLQLQTHGRFTAIHYEHHHGHHRDGPDTVYQADDCPPWALDGHVPREHFQLLIGQHQDGRHSYQLDAPRHSWALTVHLPRIDWPDTSAVAAVLGQQDDAAWLSGDEARKLGFTCLLASSGTSRLPPDQVIAAIVKLLSAPLQ